MHNRTPTSTSKFCQIACGQKTSPEIACILLRRHFARSISSRIFNDTRNLLIIIDREQTERVQVNFSCTFITFLYFFLLTASAFRCQGGIRLEPALEVLVRHCYCSTTLPLDFTTVSFVELQNEIRHKVELHSSNSLWTPLKDIFPLEDGQDLVHLSWIADENRHVASSAGE